MASAYQNSLINRTTLAALTSLRGDPRFREFLEALRKRRDDLREVWEGTHDLTESTRVQGASLELRDLLDIIDNSHEKMSRLER